MTMKIALFVQAKDLQRLLGYSQTTAYRRLKEIKAFLQKEKRQKVTIEEFAHYEGLDVSKIEKIWQKGQH